MVSAGVERWDAWLIDEVLAGETELRRSFRELVVFSKHPQQPPALVIPEGGVPPDP